MTHVFLPHCLALWSREEFSDFRLLDPFGNICASPVRTGGHGTQQFVYFTMYFEPSSGVLNSHMCFFCMWICIYICVRCIIDLYRRNIGQSMLSIWMNGEYHFSFSGMLDAQHSTGPTLGMLGEMLRLPGALLFMTPVSSGRHGQGTSRGRSSDPQH